MPFITKSNIKYINTFDKSTEYLVLSSCGYSIAFPGTKYTYEKTDFGFYSHKQISNMNYDENDMARLYIFKIKCSILETINILYKLCHEIDSAFLVASKIRSEYSDKLSSIQYKDACKIFSK